MTPETFEAEFVAYNDFLVACGRPPLTREIFGRVIERHNATIARQEQHDA